MLGFDFVVVTNKTALSSLMGFVGGFYFSFDEWVLMMVAGCLVVDSCWVCGGGSVCNG